MFLGIIGAVMGVVAAPTSAVAVPNATVAVATSEVGITQSVVGTQQQQDQGGGQGQASGSDPQEDPANDPRLAKFTLTAHRDPSQTSPDAEQIEGKQVVLRNGKLYLDDADPERRRFADGHPFAGFYIEYPLEKKPQPLGLVSTISREPPVLNWIYVDNDTLELKYGNKTQSLPHIYSPWDWTEDQQALTLDEWEGFVVIEERTGSGDWVVCYDRDDDLLQSVSGKREVLVCSLRRTLL